MSKKRKNFHYHYAEKFETQRPRTARGGRRLPMPPLAFIVCLAVLFLFGMVTTSFSVFVTSTLNDPDMPASGGLIARVRNKQLSADGDSPFSQKNDADFAGTGAEVDLSDTGTDTFTSGTYVYCNPNGKWSADSAKIGAYFFNSTTDYAWSTSLYSCGSSALRFLVPGESKTWTNVIFVRLNSDTTTSTISWDKKWNQTGDLSCDYDKNCYVISAVGGSGSWGTYLDDTKTVSLSATDTTITLCSSSHTTTMTPAFTSSYYTETGVTYTVDKAGATVNNSTGVFTATSAGTYTVTATFSFYANGFSGVTGTTTATASITVNTCSISSSPASITNMKIGDTTDVTFTGDTNHTGSKTISVTSSDSTKVSVAVKTAYNTFSRDITVTLTALKPTGSGGVNITATCAGSNVTKTLKVVVTEPELTASDISLHEGEQGTIIVNSSGTNASITPTYSWAKVTNAAPISLANGSANNQQIVTAGTYNPSYTSTKVRITATYTVGTSTYTKTKDVTVSLSALSLSIGNVSLFEGQVETITPVNSTGYEITAYSWSEDSSGTLLDTTGVDATASTFAAKAKAYSAADHEITVSLTATFGTLNDFQKTVTCKVTVKEITMTSLAMTKEEGDRGTFTPEFVTGAPTPSAYGEYPAYQWLASAFASKITLSNDTSETVTVTTKKLADNTATTASTCPKLSLTVYYATGFTKTFSNIGTVNITKSPYYLLGFGPSSGTTNWSTSNENRRMVFNPDAGKYEVKILLDKTVSYTKGTEYGFKIYIAGGVNDWYANSGSVDTITRDTQHNDLTFIAQSGGDKNTGIDADVSDYYTFTLHLSNRETCVADHDTMTAAEIIAGTKKVKVEFPVDTVKIYSNIVGSASTNDAMCEISGVTYDSTISASTITTNADFITARAALEAQGYKFTNSWESDPTSADPLSHVGVDPTRKIYAVFVPDSYDFDVSLTPTNRIDSTGGKDGTTALKAYEIPYGSAIKVSSDLIIPQGVTPAQGITYTWYTYNGSAYTSLTTGQSYTSGENTIVTTIPAESKNFTLSMRASCTDALGNTRTDDYASKTVYYKVKSALNDLEMSLGGAVVDQKIYSSAPDLRLKIYADLRAFDSALNSTTPVLAKQTTLFAKTIALLRYNNGDYTEILSENGEISANDAVPNYKSDVAAQDGSEDTLYGAKRGVNYLEFRLKDDDAYEEGSVYNFRTVVGANGNYPTRPLFFENNSGTSLSNYRVMIFYYDNTENTLVYQTAQIVDGGSGNLYRFEIPEYHSADESHTWDGNVWIAAFDKSANAKYSLPDYNGSASGDAKLSFTNVSSILFARTAATSVDGIRKLTVSPGGISSGSIAVS